MNFLVSGIPNPNPPHFPLIGGGITTAWLMLVWQQVDAGCQPTQRPE
jgi:hypothetical protein